MKPETPQLWFMLLGDVKGKEEDFCRYIIGKRKPRESMGLLLTGIGALVAHGVEKADALNAFLAIVFTNKISFQKFPALETMG